MKHCMGIAVLTGALGLSGVALAGPGDDAFVAGYAQAILEREFGLTEGRVSVREGMVTVNVADLTHEQQRRIRAALGSIRGVQAVELTGGQDVAKAAAPEVSSSTGREGATSATAASGPSDTNRAAAGAVESSLQPAGWRLFPPARTFDPLTADPRWPHFGAAWQAYQGEGLDSVGAVSFGETIAFYQGPALAPEGRRASWELGMQAGLFAIFDMDAPSLDLVNADYFVGPYAAYRLGDVSAMLRVFHQSSHLGDEYVLNNGLTPANRVNLSYEIAQVLVSYDLTPWARVYAGPGMVIDTDPKGFDALMVQYGLELTCPWTILGGRLRPVAAADVKQWEENHWSFDVSLRAGVQLENPALHGSKMQFMVEYYNGRSPNGQFYTESIRYLGAGMHFYY